MIDYDSFSRCHLTDIFFAFHAGAKELIEKSTFVSKFECQGRTPRFTDQKGNTQWKKSVSTDFCWRNAESRSSKLRLTRSDGSLICHKDYMLIKVNLAG